MTPPPHTDNCIYPAQPDGGIGVFHAALRRHHFIRIYLAPDIPPGPTGRERAAVTDTHTARIYLSEALSPAEMRAAVVHELAHLAHPECDEETVEYIAACSLVPLADADAVNAGACAHEVAARLHVDAELVEARAEGLRLLAG